MRNGRLVASIAAGTAAGSALGGMVVFTLGYLLHKREEAAQDHREWNQEIYADLAGGIRLSPAEREVLREIEWAEAPAMDGRLDDVCDDYVFNEDEGNGEESSSSG